MSKNYYEILGIKESMLRYILYKNEEGTYNTKERNVENKDTIIRCAYEEKKKKLEDEYNRDIGILEYGIKKNTNIGKKAEIEEKKKIVTAKFNDAVKELTHAYEEIQYEGLRKIYNDKLLRKDKNKERKLIEETAYDFFGISEKELKLHSDKKNDLLIRNRFDKMMGNYNLVLQKEGLEFRKRQEIQNLILKAKQYFKLIETSEKRKLYTEHLDEEENLAKNKIREKIIEEKYSKKDQYDKSLIKTIENGKLSGEKLVAKKETKNPKTIFLQDSRDMELKITAEVVFRNATGVCNSYINEYQLIRIIEGEEKVDTIYTNLVLPELAIDKNTGKPVNPEYYSCVVDELFSEEAIEGSKYNGGYIGLVEKNRDGKYIILKTKKLNPTEQEYLAAVMIIQERNEKDKKNKREEEYK